MCSGVSRLDLSRLANHAHETGLSLCLEAKNVEGNKLNILIVGDQRYDYIDAPQLRELDLLVASHHGGDYCWSKLGGIPVPSPRLFSTVIYSYGIGNTYAHPSKVEDYNIANWAQAYHTARGDYNIIISL